MNRRILLAFLLLLSALSMYGAYRVNSKDSTLKVTNIAILGENTITGVLYEPLTPLDDAPCVLLAHGITNSKEPLSGIALELAKHGHFALSIDLVAWALLWRA